MSQVDLEIVADRDRQVHHDRRRWHSETPSGPMTVIQVKPKPEGEAAPDVQAIEEQLQPGGFLDWLLRRDGARIQVKKKAK